MTFEHRFLVCSPLADVAAFHSRSANMGAITPLPVIVRVHDAPPILTEGETMDFTLWFGPLPIHWLARVEQVTPISFVDNQIAGPFAVWTHLHTFIPLGEKVTQVIDHIDAQVYSHWFWKFVGFSFWWGLPLLFAYRTWKTRRMLSVRPEHC